MFPSVQLKSTRHCAGFCNKLEMSTASVSTELGTGNGSEHFPCMKTLFMNHVYCITVFCCP